MRLFGTRERHQLLAKDAARNSLVREPSRDRAALFRMISIGTVMSGRRSLIKGFLEALSLIVGAVMSSAYRCGAMAPAGPDVVR
jgi:hypothetical protein